MNQDQDQLALLLPDVKDRLLDAAVRYFGERGNFRNDQDTDAPAGILAFLNNSAAADAQLIQDYVLETCAGYNSLDEEICFCIQPKHADTHAFGYVFAVFAEDNGAFAVSPLVINTSDCCPSKPWWDGNAFARQPGAKTLESALSYNRLINDFIV